MRGCSGESRHAVLVIQTLAVQREVSMRLADGVIGAEIERPGTRDRQALSHQGRSRSCLGRCDQVQGADLVGGSPASPLLHRDAIVPHLLTGPITHASTYP